MLTEKWFNLYMDGDHNRYMTIYDFWVQTLGLSGDGPPASSRSFKFTLQDANVPLGALQMHAKWEANGNSRVMFYNDNPAGMGTEIAYTNSLHRGGTENILFKAIPLAVEDSASGHTPVRLVPYSEKSSKPTQADKTNTFANTWSFEVTNNPN